MGDHLRQSGPSMAAIDGLAGPSMATRSAIDGLAGLVVAGDHLRRDRPLLANPVTHIYIYIHHYSLHDSCIVINIIYDIII